MLQKLNVDFSPSKPGKGGKPGQGGQAGQGGQGKAGASAAITITSGLPAGGQPAASGAQRPMQHLSSIASVGWDPGCHNCSHI